MPSETSNNKRSHTTKNPIRTHNDPSRPSHSPETENSRKQLRKTTRPQSTTGSEPNPDILTLQLHTHKSSNLFITNIYNAPAGAEGEGRALNLLTASIWSKDQHVLIAGDFNLKHDLWQPSTQQMSPRA